MKLSELFEKKNLSISFEVFPPKTDTAFESVKKAVEEKGLLGALTGPLTAAAGGTAAALIFGYLVALICKGKPKD